ncbi:beta-propeller domain-containing protein [Clostridium swellfunianum]|uniref:beta-propeller domain-containing protein n=1 Tax=Clostridium swellfunianum TaxID=1367462 RepID=UPI00202E4996|nr:beta-propeller domain-containing protein [Clostridium swellfunianum]MCM0647130.1 beta-propeller domain-containing protein [Clostridium swellfunianum]
MKDLKKDFNNIPIPKELDNVIEDALDKAERKLVLRFTKPIAAAACIGALILTLNPFLTKHFGNSPTKELANSPIEEQPAAAITISSLPTIDSYDNLKSLLASNGLILDQSMIREDALNKSSADISSQKESVNYSTTNTQVTGVDEADIVKSDGNYIYSINSNKINITKAYPASAMTVVKSIQLDVDFRVRELLLDKNHLIAIGQKNLPMRVTSKENSNVLEDKSMQKSVKDSIGISDTKAIIYDISDKSQAKEVKTVELSGYYVSSRKIDSTIFLIANQPIRDTDKPYYKDSSLGGGSLGIDYDKIKYCPNALAPSYINIASINLEKTIDAVKVDSYLGSAYTLYVSLNNLYLSGYSRNDVSTVYKFSLDNGKVNYTAKGEVAGNVLNQFSMDEHGDYFRITTTQNRNGTKQSNNLFVLDNKMNIVGKLENLAPGEQIYSTRFIGNRAYIVTFKTTDPLFVIDLKNPSNPIVLGELKIPGFSTYLHPYDENHIVGFGKNTEEVGTRVSTKGIKISMFDITDINNPKEKFTTVVGSFGTESELLYNHKALLFSKENNIFAFPVTIGYNAAELKLAEAKRLPKDYGLPAFEGAYVFSIDMDKGFILKSTLTHNENKKYEPKYFSTEEARTNKIQRILHINNTLYTISNGMIKANDMSSMKELGSVKLPK